MKKSPIAEHKQEDAELMRLTLLEIINSDTAGHKDKTEAVKALARMHSLLQADRTVEKTDTKTIKIESKDEEEILDWVSEVLHKNRRDNEIIPS